MKPESVVAWREALTRLSDQHFFDLMRMYLGAVKTPFNKQRLIEELSAFLRRKENRRNIIQYLDEFDRQILSAIYELPSPTLQKIVSVFSGTCSFPEIHERILNLEERLLIYRKNDTDNREYALNPLLEDELQPLIGLSCLISPVGNVESDISTPEQTTAAPDDITLAGLYCFFRQERISVKNDGTIRQKTLSILEGIFPLLAGRAALLPKLITSFQHLGLLIQTDGWLVSDSERWKAFAQLSGLERIAYLAAAVSGRYQREALRNRAQIFIDFLSVLIPEHLYTREAVSRLAVITGEKSGGVFAASARGRFAAMMREEEASDSRKTEVNETDSSGTAVLFGLLIESGKYLLKNPVFAAAESKEVSPHPDFVISPSFEVTLLPGYSLAELLPLVDAMEVRNIQMVGQFEITRKSCATAFEDGNDAKSLVKLFQEKSRQTMPRNAVFSIDDWYRNYSSVSLYHGYVLCVEENRRILFENNEHLASLIREKLAPGVYLLNAVSEAAIQEAFAHANLDITPTVCNAVHARTLIPLPRLSVSSDIDQKTVVSSDTISPLSENDKKNIQSLQDEMKTNLTTRNFPADVTDALNSRIDRRIVISATQLDPDSIRIEKLEARGMDFLGKVHIAEYALISGSLLEIVLDEKDGNRIVRGRPVSSEKRTSDVILSLMVEPDRAIEQISLGKAISVKRIRGSIFSELPSGRV